MSPERSAIAATRLADEFEGRLNLSFSAGATYEEKPTISYVPVSGAQYLWAARQLGGQTAPSSTVDQVCPPSSDRE